MYLPTLLTDCQYNRSLQGVLAPHSNLAALLALYFRDDLTAWATKRAGRPPPPGSPKPLSLPQLKALVQSNSAGCLDRLRLVRSPGSECLIRAL